MNHIDVTSKPKTAIALRVTADDDANRDALRAMGLKVEYDDDDGEWDVCLSDERVGIKTLAELWVLVETYHPEDADGEPYPEETETYSYVIGDAHFRDEWVAVDKERVPAWTEPTLFDPELEP